MFHGLPQDFLTWLWFKPPFDLSLNETVFLGIDEVTVFLAQDASLKFKCFPPIEEAKVEREEDQENVHGDLAHS